MSLKRFVIFLGCICILTIGHAQEIEQSVKERKKKEAENIMLNQMLSKSWELYTAGEFQKSMESNLQTIKMAEKLNNYQYAQRSYSNLGYDYLVLEDTIQALESFKKSHYYARKSKLPLSIAQAYTDFADVYVQDSATYEKGIQYFKNALVIMQQKKDTIGLTGTYYDYANALFKRGENEKFEQVLDSLVLYTTFMDSHALYQARSLNLQAANYLRNGDLESATEVLLTSIMLAESESSNDQLENAYKLYADVLKRKEQYRPALATMVKYDSIYRLNQKARNLSETRRVAAKFQINQVEEERDQAQLKIELQENKFQQRALVNYMLTGVIVLGSGFIIFLIYLARRRKSFIKSLEIKNEQVSKAKMEAERLARVKSNFFSTVSHELRTPLYGVIGLSSILLEKNRDEESLQDLKSLKFSADYLLALVNDVLQLNKIDSSKGLENNEEVFNVAKLIENITSSFEYIRIQNNNIVEIACDRKLPHLIKGNSTQLSQIMMNLIGNACKFTENGKIRVGARSAIKDNVVTIEFSIADTGQGIAPNKIQQIFEEFAQGESKNLTYQGTGLGLSIVKKLLHAAGSEIHVDSIIGKGSRFSFKMSYDIIQEKATEDSEALEEIKIFHIRDLSGCHVLVVEDNKINQMVTKKILEKDNVICDLAENGAVAVQKVKESNYDLVLMDVNMPVMDGLEATQAIRKFSNVPIVALTAVELEEMRERIYNSGMDDIVVKPYDVKSFQQIILKHIQLHRADDTI